MDSQELEKQFMDIVTRNKQIIYKVCYIYATDNDNLNDLYQEVVINLWKAFPRFRANAKNRHIEQSLAELREFENEKE